MPQCPSAPVPQCPSAPVIQCSSAPVPQCSNAPVPQCPSAPVLQCPSAPVPQCPSAPMPQCPSAPVPQCSSAPVPQCSSAPVSSPGLIPVYSALNKLLHWGVQHPSCICVLAIGILRTFTIALQISLLETEMLSFFLIKNPELKKKKITIGYCWCNELYIFCRNSIPHDNWIVYVMEDAFAVEHYFNNCCIGYGYLD